MHVGEVRPERDCCELCSSTPALVFLFSSPMLPLSPTLVLWGQVGRGGDRRDGMKFTCTTSFLPGIKTGEVTVSGLDEALLCVLPAIGAMLFMHPPPI